MSSVFAALAACGLGLYGVTFSAQAATVVWDFNLPATSTSSLNPPYESIATLKLEDTVDGVKFTLDPNELNSGFSANSTIDSLNIAFDGSDLPSSSYSYLSGSQADPNSFGTSNAPLVAVVPPPTSAANLDSNYTSQAGQLLLRWGNPDFPVSSISAWVILGTTIADNFSVFATSTSKPSPIFGIISVSDISLDGLNPTPSNWVTGSKPTYTDFNVGDVPVPAALPLLMSAFGIFGFFGWRRRKLSGA